MLPHETLLKKIDTIQSVLLKEIEQMIKTGVDKKQIAVFVDSIDFDELLDEFGLNKAVLEYVYSLDEIVNSFGKGIATNLLDEIEMIQNLQSEYILGSMSNKIKLWKSTMIEGFITGREDKFILESLQTIGLTEAQAGTVLQTSYYNFERAVTSIAYEDSPEQKFEYRGGIIPTSSRQCEWLFNNQDPAGYTKSEIDVGIETPFGIIDWFGRQPNYNCLHSWVAI